MNYVQRKCSNCFVMFSVNNSDPSPLCTSCNHKDILNELEFEVFSDNTCFKHKWVWSGVPKGMVWCSKCNIDYDEKKHGSIKDLSGQ